MEMFKGKNFKALSGYWVWGRDKIEQNWGTKKLF